MVSAFGAAAAVYLSRGNSSDKQVDRPNILWITTEDISPDLGCYGVDYAITPNLDQLASDGVMFTNAYAICGVCAPNRSCLATGVYPTTLGSHDMRSNSWLPGYIKCLSVYMKQAGYYCTNHKKTDYNFKASKDIWDKGENWQARKSPDQPFFSVINYIPTHESHCRGEPDDKKRFDPAKVPVPPFHPDTPEVRNNWARYHENIHGMDKWAAGILNKLQADGLDTDTIVFFFGDHGAGLPGCKKWIKQAGIKVPFIIRCPEKYQHLMPMEPGKQCNRMISFIDLPPTILSLAGIPIPDHMQGEPFMGKAMTCPRKYIYAHRGRMAERYDIARTVRSSKYQYIRNFMPHLPCLQYVSYTEEMPATSAWRKLHEEGKLNETRNAYFITPRPVEELYDVAKDPHQINNLAGEKKFQSILVEMRQELKNWMIKTHDLGLLPEYEMHRRAKGSSPHEIAADSEANPIEKLIRAADLANEMDEKNSTELADMMLKDQDAAVRWWGAMGLVSLGKKATSELDAVRKATNDKNPVVQMAVAEILCNLEKYDEALVLLKAGLKNPTAFIRLRALNILDRIGIHARPALTEIRSAGMKGKQPAQYLSRMVKYVPERLK